MSKITGIFGNFENNGIIHGNFGRLFLRKFWVFSGAIETVNRTQCLMQLIKGRGGKKHITKKVQKEIKPIGFQKNNC